MKPAIAIENLGKSYQLGHEVERNGYRTFRESLCQLGKSTWRSLRARHNDAAKEEFWALTDVSCEVHPGEVVGVVGRNGAGKSTLLKILSRITRPTTGSIVLNGRVGSLLEVGTGFHPELTGRENIYLNGSILGMERSRIRSQFDQIVEFAEISRFLDTPVKRYSSGMYVRLAFAVAAHLDPEILLIDEVLAVGDIAFQNKCVSRMEEVARSGRTVLFVSHNMAAVQSICSRALLIQGGRLVSSGQTSEVIAQFIESMAVEGEGVLGREISLGSHVNRRRSSKVVMCKLRIAGAVTSQPAIPVGGRVTFQLSFSTKEAFPGAAFAIFLCTRDGQRLAMLNSRVHSRLELGGEQSGLVTCEVPALPLLPGTYRVDVAVATSDGAIDYIEQAAVLPVIASDVFGTGDLPTSRQGVFAIPSSWKLHR